MAALGVLLVLAAAGLHLGAAAVAAHRARAAADLAALAGAAHLQEGGWGEACQRAAALSVRHGARLETCSIEAAETVLVRASVQVATRWPGLPDRATASARAGPEP